jgi:hypothetical protein
VITGQLKEFKDAIEDEYYFEMLIDDLPLWGTVGEVSGQAQCECLIC